MKPACLLPIVLCCLASFAIRAQAPSVSVTRYDSTQQVIIDGEKQGHRALFGQPEKGDLGFTVASNNFHVNYYRCEWQVDPTIRAITGKVTSHFTINAPSTSITYDLSDTLTVDSVTWHGSAIGFQRPGNDALVLQFPLALGTNQQDSVSVYYKGVPRLNIPNGGFSTSIIDVYPVLWTLSEPYGAKEWWPCKNGLGDKADSIDFAITCPSTYTGVSNGVLQGSEVKGANTTYYYKHRYPIATYLVAFAASIYMQFRDTVQVGSRRMPVLLNYVPTSYYNLKNGQANAVKMVSLFSTYFGDYPFANEQYSQTQVRIGGGMEHQTNTFLNSDDYQLVAHELGHHWFGDKVTCASWRDIWLNEGFGNYMQFLAVQNYEPAIIPAHLTYYINSATSSPGGSVYVDDTTSVNRVFSGSLTYAKGGYVIHMLRGILGDSVFFQGLRTYLNDPLLKYNFAKTADLERNLEQASGKDLHSFFQKWIYGQGYPNYTATWMQNNNGWIKLQLSQTTSHPSVSFYEMPVRLRLMNAHGDTANVIVDHQQNGQVFWLNPGFSPDSIAIDPDLWILAKVKTSKKIPAASTTPNDIKIYPNPAPARLYISLFNPVADRLSIRLYSASGQLVYTQEKDLNGQDETIDIPTSTLAKGAYILKLSDGKNLNIIKKLMK